MNGKPGTSVSLQRVRKQAAGYERDKRLVGEEDRGRGLATGRRPGGDQAIFTSPFAVALG